MQIKSSIKIGILFVFIIAIIVIGFVMFRRLDHNKQVFEKEITSMVPVDASFVLQINKNKKIEKLTKLSGNLGIFIDSIQESMTFPIYIVGKDNNSAIVSKLTIQQEAELRDKLDKVLFPSYPPKIKIYNNTDILFYATTDNSFFCCAFDNGVFIGSYNYKLIEGILNTKHKANFFSQPNAENMLNYAKSTYSANLYLSICDSMSIFNMSLDNDSIVLDGFIRKYSNADIDTTTNYTINQSILPDTMVAYKISMNYDNLADTMKTYLSAPLYQFYTDTINQPVYAIELKVDRFVVFNYLNNLEIKYIGRKFGIHDFAFGDQRIYTTSAQLSKFIFKMNEIVYFTFFKNHLIYSSSKPLLVNYLIKSGKNRDTISNRIVDENADIETLFYSSSPKTISPSFFPCNFGNYNIESIYGIEYIENNTKKLTVILK